MFRLTIQSILAHKRRLIGTALSVIIGVAFLAGTFIFTDTINDTFDNLFADVYEQTDAVVRSSQSLDVQFADDVRNRIPDSIVAEVAAIPGVTAAVGNVQGFARIIGADGEPIGRDNGPPTYGGTLSDSPLSPWTLTEASSYPTARDQVVIDAGSAKQGDLEIGDSVTVIGQAGSRQFTVVGIARFGDADSPGGATFALFDLPTAEEFVGKPGHVDTVLAKGDGTLDEAEFARQVRAALPPNAELEVLTGAEISKESSDSIEESLSFFNVLLLVFAGISLFVSAFIIYNTFSIIVAQRQQENALLRAIGASRPQVLGSMLLEATIIGLVASVIGFAGGFAMSSLLKAGLAALNIDIPAGDVVVLPRTAIVSLVVGMLVTLVAAVAPSVRGSRVPPIAAMRDVALDRSGTSRRRFVAGSLVTLAGVAATLGGLTGAVTLLALGIPLLFVGMFVLGPLIARPVSRLLGAPLPPLKGMAGTIARENAMRNPKRTARTAAALMVGVAVVAGISVLAASIKSSVRDIFSEQFTGDFVVNASGSGFGGLPPALAEEVDALPEVAAATGIGIGYGRVGDSDEALTLVDPTTAGEVFDLDFTQGSMTELTDSGILLSTSRADSDGLNIGDTVDLTMLNGESRRLTVQGTYDKDELAGSYSISKQLYAESGADTFDFSVFIRKAPDVSDAAAEAAIGKVAAAYPNGDVESRTDYIDNQAASIDQFVNLIYGLLALAVIIAVFGIANTLSLSIYERTRELGLLRAVGMSRSQVRSSVRWESVITALLGAVQGVVIGVLLGYAVVFALRDEGLDRFTVPTAAIVIILVLAVLAGLVAALRPARRAARLEVLRAIAAH